MNGASWTWVIQGGALVIIGLGFTGKWYYGPTVERLLAAKDVIIARLDQEMKEKDRLIAEANNRADQWREQAIKGREVTREAVDTTKVVALSRQEGGNVENH